MYEKYQLSRRSRVPTLSIREDGTFYFSQSAVREFHLDKYKYATLYYNNPEKKIGIELQNKKEKGAIELRRYSYHKNKTSDVRVQFFSATFLEYYGIEVKKLKRRKIRETKKGMLEVSL